jgi:hypothetical protein
MDKLSGPSAIALEQGLQVLLGQRSQWIVRVWKFLPGLFHIPEQMGGGIDEVIDHLFIVREFLDQDLRDAAQGLMYGFLPLFPSHLLGMPPLQVGGEYARSVHPQGFLQIMKGQGGNRIRFLGMIRWRAGGQAPLNGLFTFLYFFS